VFYITEQRDLDEALSDGEAPLRIYFLLPELESSEDYDDCKY
jgi:hypothetical protein